MAAPSWQPRQGVSHCKVALDVQCWTVLRCGCPHSLHSHAAATTSLLQASDHQLLPVGKQSWRRRRASAGPPWVCGHMQQRQFLHRARRGGLDSDHQIPDAWHHTGPLHRAVPCQQHPHQRARLFPHSGAKPCLTSRGEGDALMQVPGVKSKPTAWSPSEV